TAGYSKGVVKPFFVGLPISAAVVLASVALNKLSGTFGKIAAIAVVCVYMVYAHTGVSGLATFIGQRLPSPADAERPWKSTLRGGIVLELTYLLPILGWFVILPASIIMGSGAITWALFQRRKAPVATPTLSIKSDAAPAAPVEGSVGVPR